MRPAANENESGTAGTRTQNQRIMSHRGSGTLPEEIAVSARSAAHCAANCSSSPADDDPRLLELIDAWPTLLEDTRDAIAKLVGLPPDDADGVGDVMAVAAKEAVSR